MYFSTNTRSSPKAAAASRDAEDIASGKSDGFCTSRIPLPPPPPAAFTITGNSDEALIAEAERGEDIAKASYEKALAELPLEEGPDGLDGLLNEVLKQGVSYRIQGEAVFGTMLGSYTYPFDVEKKSKKKQADKKETEL